MAGWRPLFLPANAGRDVLYTYLQAPLLAFLGDTLAVARGASALVGTLAVPLVWWMVRTVGGPARGAPAAAGIAAAGRTALTAAALVAASLWHLHFSRFGIRAILLPSFVAVVVATWWTATTAAAPIRRRQAAVAAGVALGLAAYAHPAGRGLVALPAAHALWLAVAARRARARSAPAGAGIVDADIDADTAPRPLAALAIAAGVALVVALPLVVTWLRQPWLATGHAAEVSILGGGWRAVAANAGRVALMFNVAGDPAPWRNLPGRPAFDALGGGAFLVGLAVALRDAARGRGWAALALLALLGLALPSVLTDQAPNFSRAIGVVPIAAWLAAVGLDAAADGLARLPRPGTRVAARARAAADTALAWQLPLVAVGAAVLATGRDLRAHYGDPATPIAFDADVAAFAAWVDDLPPAPRPATSPATADHATYRAVAHRPAGSFDAAHGLVVPLDGDGRGAVRVVDVARLPWAGAQRAGLEGWAWRADRAALAGGSAVPVPGVALSVETAAPAGLGGAADTALPAAPDAVGLIHDVVVRADARAALAGAAGPRWDGAITLVAAAVPAELTAGRTADVVVAWRAEAPTARSLSTAVQLVTAAGDAIAGGDGLPVGGSAPTDRWRAGDLVVSRHAIAVPADAPPGPAVLNVGWYALSYPDGPTAPPRFDTVADDRGRAVAPAATTVVVAADGARGARPVTRPSSPAAGGGR